MDIVLLFANTPPRSTGAWVAKHVVKEVGSEKMLECHWDGKVDLLLLLDEILDREHSLIDDKATSIFGYIGFNESISTL